MALLSFSLNLMASETATKNTPNPEVLQINTFTVGNGIAVQLPTLRMADGTICTSYVASVSTDAVEPLNETKTTVETNKICDKPYVVKDYTGFGLSETVYPAKLKALNTFTAGGLSIQLPQISGR